MKLFEWNEEKNKKLKEERGIGFEDVKTAIEEGKVKSIETHPNKVKYPNQKMMIVEIEAYVYLVPFVEDKTKYFLKTIIPSRKATKKYLSKRKEKI